MKLFISWSGRRSKETAKLLHGWIPQLINEVEPWMSDIDINTGGDWGDEIKLQLNAADFGIICVTPGNMKREWLLFEAGALSRQVNDTASRVAPFLIGFNEKSELRFPLARFQSTEPTVDDMRKLLLSINAQCLKPRSPEQIDVALNVFWPTFETAFTQIRDSSPTQPQERRSERDLLQEILSIVRSLDKRPTSEAGGTSAYRLALRDRLEYGIPASLEPKMPAITFQDSGVSPVIYKRLQDLAERRGFALNDIDISDGGVPVAVVLPVIGGTKARERFRALHKEVMDDLGIDIVLKLSE